VGPIEEAGRPLVDIREIVFDPKTSTFNLTFNRGGTGTVGLASAIPGATVVDVQFDPPIGGDQPFAALRSMYVTPDNADVAQVRFAGDQPRRPILDFTSEQTSHVHFGREVVSRHNTSAPDMIFSGFSWGIGIE
jgi:hypothetical protein